MINLDTLKYQLIRGISIPYMNVKIYQPTIEEIDEILPSYDSYKFIYCANKDFLQFEEGEGIDDFKDYTYFQTLFKMKNKLYLRMLISSLEFFLKVKIANDNIRISNNMEIAIVDDEGKNILLTLDDTNFEEFSELIRLICCCEKMTKEEDKDHLKPTTIYKSEALRRMYEDSIKQYNDYQDKKKRENAFTLSDIIGGTCINEKTKYKFKDIDDLTIWQLYYIYNGMFVREGNEFTKMQFCSYKFSFENIPDFNWIKEAKVKLPESMIKQ